MLATMANHSERCTGCPACSEEAAAILDARGGAAKLRAMARFLEAQANGTARRQKWDALARPAPTPKPAPAPKPTPRPVPVPSAWGEATLDTKFAEAAARGPVDAWSLRVEAKR